MSNFINIDTLERVSCQDNDNIVPLTCFINGVDLEMWHANKQHMQDCAAGHYGNEAATINYAKEWLQRAMEIDQLLVKRAIPPGNAGVAVVVDPNGKL